MKNEIKLFIDITIILYTIFILCFVFFHKENKPAILPAETTAIIETT